MTRITVALLLLGALAACKRREQSEWARATWNPAHRVELDRPDALSAWIDGRAGNDVQSIWLSPVTKFVRFDPLTRLQNLRAITLSGFGTPSPTKSGNEFVFPPVLSDQQVADLARVRTLRAIALWYGSFSDEQRRVLRAAIPDVELLENLNKL